MAIRRVRVNWSGVTVVGGGLSTFYFTSDTGTAQDCVDAVADMLGVIDGSLSNTLSWSTDPDVPTLDTGTGEITGFASSSPQTGAGSSSSTILPPATQGLVRFRTNFIVAGRELRGRFFIPGLTTALQDGGAPTSAFRTAVEGAANTFISDAGVVPVVWSRAHGAAASIEDASLWTKWSVLRSRRD